MHELKYILDVKAMALASPRHTCMLKVHAIHQRATPDKEPYLEIEATPFQMGAYRETIRVYASAIIIESPDNEWTAWCERHCVMSRR